MLTLLVDGMTCDHCKKAVEQALQGVAGVDRVAVSLADNKAEVEGSADPQLLIAAVEEEGFQARLP